MYCDNGSFRMIPLNFKQWIKDHRAELKPPVGNQQIWPNREFMVTVVAGPNARKDFHINEGEEFFHQLEGDMVLRVMEGGQPVEIPIREGEIFLLPPNIPHSPQRPAGTLGLVIERRRLPHERDGFVWFCEQCQGKLYAEFFHLTDIVAQLPPVFERFFSSDKNTTCQDCGARMEREEKRK